VTSARRNNLSVYSGVNDVVCSGVNNVISGVVMPCSGKYTASGDLAVFVSRYCSYC